MALKLQLMGMLLVLELMGCQGSDCQAASKAYSDKVGTLLKGFGCKENPCPDGCKSAVTDYYSKCGGNKETWTHEDGTIYEVGEYPFELIAIGSGFSSDTCKDFNHDESMKHVKNCNHAFSIFFYNSVFPYCSQNSGSSCDKRCQDAIDAILGNCKTGDTYKVGTTVVTVDEKTLAADLKSRGPSTCKYEAPKKSIISNTLSNPWKFAVFLAISISWSFGF